LLRSLIKRPRDFGPIFEPIGRFLPHPGRDGFGTETLGSRCECGKPCKERRETKKAERVTLGWIALTPWWTGLQAKTKSSLVETLFVTMRAETQREIRWVFQGKREFGSHSVAAGTRATLCEIRTDR